MEKWLKPIKFSLCMIPIAIIAGILVGLYHLETITKEALNQLILQLGSVQALIAINCIQIIVLTSICSFFGYLLADKVGLLKDFRLNRKFIIAILPTTMATGILFSLDYWTFGKLIPQVYQSYQISITPLAFGTAVVYGGIIEEILLRFFMMSLIVFIVWKAMFKKYQKENIPQVVFIIANIVAAMFFAAGHLPATMGIFGELTPLIFFRCFLLNGGFGLFFGYHFIKYGLQYAMISHGFVHIISK